MNKFTDKKLTINNCRRKFEKLDIKYYDQIKFYFDRQI